MIYKLGNYKLGNLLDMRNVALYLFGYHLVFSGLITFNKFNGNLPDLPLLTELFFGIPFILYFFAYLGRLVTRPASPRYFWRHAVFLLMLLYVSGVIIYNQYTHHYGIEVWSFNAIILMWYFISFFIGTELNISPGEKGKKFIMALYILLVLNVLLNYRIGDQRLMVDDDHLGIFLFMGDSFALWSLFAISQYKKSYVSVFMVFVSIVCLYLLSSRSSLYGFIFLVPFIFRKTGNALIKFTFMLVGIAILGIFIANINSLMSTHMLKFLFTGYDHSFWLRGVIMDQNMDDVFNNWFWGDYAGQLKYGVFGLYIHNYLSLWRQFGLIPFIIFIGMMLPFLRLFFQWFRGRKYEEYDYLFYMVIFLLLEIIFTRSYKSHYIWFAIGIMTNVLNREYRRRLALKRSVQPAVPEA